MDRKRRIVCDIGFALLCVGLFYLMPYIGWRTMEGDKTDILMGMVLCFIPIGLLLVSALYGFLTQRVFIPICIACALSIPAVFLPIVAGRTVEGRVAALVWILTVVCVLVCLGAGAGGCVRWLCRKCRERKEDA